MEISQKIKRNIRIATILLSIEICFDILLLSSNFFSAAVNIVIVASLIFLIHKKTKWSYNIAKILTFFMFIQVLYSWAYIRGQQNTGYLAVYVYYLVLWVTIFCLIISVYIKLFLKNKALEGEKNSFSRSIIEILESIGLNHFK